MNVAVVGYTGRVGREIINLLKDMDHNFVAGWGSQGQSMINDFDSNWDPDQIEIVIDFSLPENFKDVVSWCQAHSKPLVSGVTGLGEIHTESLKTIMGQSFKIKAPIFWASNMSVGIALMKQFIEMTKVFHSKKVSISETHHVHKKDSPSGTALSLALKAKQSLGLNYEIPIEAFRTDEVFGVHTLRFESDDEVIQIYHEAMNRKVFASGSIKVAEWLVQKREAQMYFMEDFIQDSNKI